MYTKILHKDVYDFHLRLMLNDSLQERAAHRRDSLEFNLSTCLVNISKSGTRVMHLYLSSVFGIRIIHDSYKLRLIQMTMFKQPGDIFEYQR